VRILKVVRDIFGRAGITFTLRPGAVWKLKVSLKTHQLVPTSAVQTMAFSKEVIICTLYALFLVLQLLGMILYGTRAISCCVEERLLSYQCKNFTLFSHSLEIELAWLFAHLMNLGIALIVVFQVPEFPGYYQLYRKLIRLPKFWSFYCLLGVAIVDFVLILGFHEQGSRLQETVVATFLAENIITVVVVGVFNFTQLKQLAKRFSPFPRILIKTTLTLFCVTNCAMFLIGTIQLSFKVTGLNHRLALDLSEEAQIIFGVLRNFAYVIFYHHAASFFWQKLFVDDRNILSHFQLLQTSYRLADI
jgi:hypothetical protein